jgi:Virulence activator alpha C-term
VGSHPAPPEPARSEVLLRINSLWLAKTARARATIADQRRRHLDTLSISSRLPPNSSDKNPIDPTTPLFCTYATLRRGLSFERHAVDWCDWLLDVLDHAAAISG